MQLKSRTGAFRPLYLICHECKIISSSAASAVRPTYELGRSRKTQSRPRGCSTDWLLVSCDGSYQSPFDAGVVCTKRGLTASLVKLLSLSLSLYTSRPLLLVLCGPIHVVSALVGLSSMPLGPSEGGVSNAVGDSARKATPADMVPWKWTGLLPNNRRRATPATRLALLLTCCDLMCCRGVAAVLHGRHPQHRPQHLKGTKLSIRKLLEPVLARACNPDCGPDSRRGLPCWI